MAERVADRLARYRPPALLARHRGAHRQLVERRARRQAEAQRALFILVVADALLDDLGKGPAEQFVQRPPQFRRDGRRDIDEMAIAGGLPEPAAAGALRSEEHTSEIQSLMSTVYGGSC